MRSTAILFAGALFAITACTEEPPAPDPIADQPLQGELFGEPWEVTFGVVRPESDLDIAYAGDASIELYETEPPDDPCEATREVAGARTLLVPIPAEAGVYDLCTAEAYACSQERSVRAYHQTSELEHETRTFGDGTIRIFTVSDTRLRGALVAEWAREGHVIEGNFSATRCAASE